MRTCRVMGPAWPLPLPAELKYCLCSNGADVRPCVHDSMHQLCDKDATCIRFRASAHAPVRRMQGQPNLLCFASYFMWLWRLIRLCVARRSEAWPFIIVARIEHRLRSRLIDFRLTGAHGGLVLAHHDAEPLSGDFVASNLDC